MAAALGLCAVVLSGSLAGAGAVGEGAELIGTRALTWRGVKWLNTPPLSLQQLRGRVVLVRWWTGPECPYCAASAPHLNDWYARYRARGLVVIGFYHHKSPTPVTRASVASLVQRHGFQFPVAIDPGWRTLKRWWLDGRERAWTSVSFLIDQEGVIRYVHSGGSYSTEEAQEIEAAIQALLGRQDEAGI